MTMVSTPRARTGGCFARATGGYLQRSGAGTITAVGPEWTAEEFSGFGCPCPALPPGVLSAAGDVLCESFRNVHFAGTETSIEWKGILEGAVRSGERGASEVQDQLKALSMFR